MRLRATRDFRNDFKKGELRFDPYRMTSLWQRLSRTGYETPWGWRCGWFMQLPWRCRILGHDWSLYGAGEHESITHHCSRCLAKHVESKPPENVQDLFCGMGGCEMRDDESSPVDALRKAVGEV